MYVYRKTTLSYPSSLFICNPNNRLPDISSLMQPGNCLASLRQIVPVLAVRDHATLHERNDFVLEGRQGGHDERMREEEAAHVQVPLEDLFKDL